MNNYQTEKDQDLALWKQYKATKSPQTKQELLRRFEPLLQSQIRKWAGPVPATVLRNEARLLAAKAFDTYNENMGTSLSTHVTNSIAPISRTVYKHQNAARLPENITLRMGAYNQADDYLRNTHGREPTLTELRDQLGWSHKEIARIQQYNRGDLVESAGEVGNAFFSEDKSKDDDLLSAIYIDLLPDEKRLFEQLTGYPYGQPKSNPEVCKALNISQAQLSYRKTKLYEKINRMMK